MEFHTRSHQVQIDSSISLLIRKWPLFLALGFLGAMVGFALSTIRKPRYEAEAVMGINIQYSVIEPLELVVEDRAQNRVADVILADSTLIQVLENITQDLRQDQGWQTASDLRQFLRLDRGLSNWGFVVIHSDPVLAAQVSNLWLEIGFAELIEAQDHAWRAMALTGDEPFQLECDQYLLPSERIETYGWRCDLEPISLDQDALAGRLRTEISLSRGILPVFSFEALKEAEVPQRPVVYNRGIMILCGAFIGLILGVWLALALPRKQSK